MSPAEPVAAGPTALVRLRRRVLGLPAPVHALLVWLAARAVTWLVTGRVARFQEANGWTGAEPGYLEFAGIWDGDWYRRIAAGGYPVPLPRDAAGVAVQSEWAFFPAYPVLVRGVQTLTGLDWVVAAPTVSLLLGAAAAVVVHRLFTTRVGHGTALVGVALLATFPSAPVTQYAYTESLALLALASALLLLVTRRYAACALAVVVLGLTRPVGLPLAVVVGVHLVVRHRAEGGLAPLRLAGLLGLGGLAVFSGLAWPLVTGLVHGDLGVYAEVQAAWRGGGDVAWLTEWWAMSRFVLGDWVGPLVLVAGLATFVVVLARPWAAALGPEMRTWCLAYGAYLVAVVEPLTPMVRFWLLMFPLALLAATAVRTRAHLVTWLAAHLALQAVWVAWLWRFSPPSDWPP